MKKVQRMLNFHTYKRLFCANCDVIAKNLRIKSEGLRGKSEELLIMNYEL